MALWNSSIMQMIMGGGGKATEKSSWNDWNDAVSEYDQAMAQTPKLDEIQLMQPQQQPLIQGPGLQLGKGSTGMPFGYGQNGLQVGGSFQDYLKKIMSLIGR